MFTRGYLRSRRYRGGDASKKVFFNPTEATSAYGNLLSRVVAPFVSRSCQVLVPLDPSVAWRMRALVNLTSFCRLDKLNWKIGYRRFCSGQCLHRLARHVWSKGWDRRESRPQPRFPAPRHRPLPHLLPLAITPPGEGRPCQPQDCPYPPDFTRGTMVVPRSRPASSVAIISFPRRCC